jgi:hypothetical protein
MKAPLLIVLGALLFFPVAPSYANAVREFRKHVPEWDYQSTDQYGERCLIELFGSRDGGLRVDIAASSLLQFHLAADTKYQSNSQLFVATTPAPSDSGVALMRLIVRNKSELTIEREFTNRAGRVYVWGLTCPLIIR